MNAKQEKMVMPWMSSGYISQFRDQFLTLVKFPGAKIITKRNSLKCKNMFCMDLDTFPRLEIYKQNPSG